MRESSVPLVESRLRESARAAVLAYAAFIAATETTDSAECAIARACARLLDQPETFGHDAAAALRRAANMF